jgi:hypothetical protein
MTSDYRIPAPLQNTIDNLSFLARTQEGEKLFFKEKIRIISSDWGARIRRYYYNENFDSQKKIIKEIVESGLLRNTYLLEIRETGELDTIIYMMEQQIEDNEKEQKRDYIQEENQKNESSESDSE